MKLPIYLDHNATTPCDPRVVEAMIPYFSVDYGNAASRNHAFGWKAAEAVEIAREQVADLIGAEKTEIVFTSGATEAVNLAIKGVFEAYGEKGNHIITTSIEHKAVLDTVRYLEKKGASATYIPVDENGLVDVSKIESAITPETILIAVMYANNELGVIQPITEIGKIAKRNEVLFFTDASQATGKIPVNVINDGIDLLALTAHKMYGPKGTGALYVRRKNPRVRVIAEIHGGGHERGMRSGTLNVPAIVGFGKAASISMKEMNADSKRLSILRDKLENALLALNEVNVNGSKEFRLPHVTNLSFRYAESEALMMSLSKKLALSSGSACSSASIEPSHVLKAIGLNDEMAHSSLRFGLGRFTTEEEIDFAIAELKNAVEQFRESSYLWKINNE